MRAGHVSATQSRAGLAHPRVETVGRAGIEHELTSRTQVLEQVSQPAEQSGPQRGPELGGRWRGDGPALDRAPLGAPLGQTAVEHRNPVVTE